jgi:hypothetical protein
MIPLKIISSLLNKRNLNILSVLAILVMVFLGIRYVERRKREQALQNVGTDVNRIAIAFRTLLYPWGDAIGTNTGQNVDEEAVIELARQTGRKFAEVQKIYYTLYKDNLLQEIYDALNAKEREEFDLAIT